jgi:hypothetical protein
VSRNSDFKLKKKGIKKNQEGERGISKREREREREIEKETEII